MGKYIVKTEEKARQELKIYQKFGDTATIKRIERIFKELAIHPYEGIGNPEALKYALTGFWSRRLNKKDRLIYTVDENVVLVIVVSAQGHYKK